MSFVTTWMDNEGIMLSEISQTGKDKYSTLSLVCGTKKNPQLLGTENRLVIARVGAEGGGNG